MSLKNVRFCDVNGNGKNDHGNRTLQSYIYWCPCLEKLELEECYLGDKRGISAFLISCSTLKYLEIVNCYCGCGLLVQSSYLCIFKCVLNSYWGDPTVARGDHIVALSHAGCLKSIDIYSVGMRQLWLSGCKNSISGSIFTPNLVRFCYSKWVKKSSFHFVESPLKLFKVEMSLDTIDKYSLKFYDCLRSFLNTFDCAREVLITCVDPEALMIPEHCRMKWSSPLPSVKLLQLSCPRRNEDTYHLLTSSLTWIAPSADIIPSVYS